MTIREIHQVRDPSKAAPLFPDSGLQLVSGEIASPRSLLSHESIVLPSESLRKHYCDMKTLSQQGTAFSQWFKRELARREMSQAEFARRSGFSTGVVSGWYQGKRVPEPASVDRIADVLALDMDYVLTMAGHRPPAFEVDPASPEGILVPIIRRIEWTERDVENMRLQLEGMAKKWPKTSG